MFWSYYNPPNSGVNFIGRRGKKFAKLQKMLKQNSEIVQFFFFYKKVAVYCENSLPYFNLKKYRGDAL
jgi:hypothetical protein